MGYQKRYYINFVGMPQQNISASSYRVDFWRRYPDNVIAPAAIELEGGPTPFLHSLSDVDDLLTPLRASTARISFCDDIALGDMLPADGFEWKVTLTRLDDGKQMFVGYLTAEVYTQPDVEGPNIVTVNAASPLTPIAATTMKLLGVGSLSIGSLIHSAISECDGIDRVYIPAQYTINKAASRADFTDILRWQMSSSNFIRTTDSGVVTGEDFECDNYSAALEAVCRLFGWSLTDTGDGALYFVSPGYAGEYMQLTKAQLIATEAFTPTMVTPTITNEGYLQPIDNGDTVDFRQGVGSAMITAQPQSADLNLPGWGEVVFDQAFTQGKVGVYVENYSGDADVYDAQVAKLTTTLNNTRLRLHSYKLENEQWVEVKADKDNTGYAGASYEKFDWFDPAKLDDEQDKKREWSFQEAIKIIESYNRVLLPQDLPIVTATMRGGAFAGGAFVLDLSAMASPVEGFYIPADPYWQGGSMADPTSGVSYNQYMVRFPYWGTSVGGGFTGLNVSLRCGNKYYNGEKWVDTFSKFIVKISNESAQWHPILTNKTLDMPYAGSSGWYIPINELLDGDIEIKIYQSFASSESLNSPASGKLGLVPNVYIKGLSLQYAETYTFKEVTAKDVTFYKDFGSSFTERKEIALPIHGRINSSEQMSLLYDSGVTAIDKVWRTTAAEAAKPEQHLLTNVERLFASASQKWRRGAAIIDVRPIDLFSRAGNKMMAMSGLTLNYAESAIELSIAEVKSETPIRYVE